MRKAILLLFIVFLFSYCKPVLQFTATLTQVDQIHHSAFYLYSSHSSWRLTFDNGQVIEVEISPPSGNYKTGTKYSIFKDWSGVFPIFKKED